MVSVRFPLLAAVCLAAAFSAALPAGDTPVASTRGGAVVEGTFTLNAVVVRYRADGVKLTLTVTGDSLVVRYADGTAMVTLQAGDTVLVTGELFTKGIGGVFNAQGFTLVPGLRFTIKNQGLKPLAFFDNRLNKTVTVPAGAVVNLEVKIEAIHTSDDLAKQLAIGQLVTIGSKKESPSAAVARIAAGLLLWANENVVLQYGALQISLVPDSALLLTAGSFKLVDGRLVLTGESITVMTLSGAVVMLSPAGKFDLAPGQSATGRGRSFSNPVQGTAPPGILVVRLQLASSSAQVPVGPRNAAAKDKVVMVLRLRSIHSTRTTGSFWTITITGAERDQVSPIH